MMKKLFFLAACMMMAATTALAHGNETLEPMKLVTPEMKPELTQPAPITLAYDADAETATVSESRSIMLANKDTGWKPDVRFFKQVTNPGVKPYKFMDDLTFVGVPLFVAGLAVKGDKAMFRVNRKAEQGGKSNIQLLSNFKTGIDDYTQFFGPAAVVGLKLGGVEGRSDWPRLLASAGMSYGLMAILVNGIKYTAKEMRPDGTSANSWPSGHTATAFVGATLLHKEYGLTRSPWYSVAGYGVATATGVMRVLNNRHWISDIMSGAGIGIMATELGYAFSDLLFKGKGLLRNDLMIDSEKPSFFSISMGLGLGSKDIEFGVEDIVDGTNLEGLSYGEKDRIQFRAATVVDAEGAYFFNKYIGVGGRLRVRAMSAKSFGQYAELLAVEDWNAWYGLYPAYKSVYPQDYPYDDNTDEGSAFNALNYYQKLGYQYTDDDQEDHTSPVTDIYGTVESDHLTEFTGSVGLYFNLPLGSGFSLGSKLLIGRSFTQELDIDGHAEGNVKDIPYKYTVDNSSSKVTDPLSFQQLDYPVNTGEKWSDKWDYLTLGTQSATSFGTGISLTYRYKSNFSWRLFVDYDYSEKKFNMKYDPYHFMKYGMTETSQSLTTVVATNTSLFDGIEYRKKKNMHYVTLGLSFLVNF